MWKHSRKLLAYNTTILHVGFLWLLSFACVYLQMSLVLRWTGLHWTKRWLPQIYTPWHYNVDDSVHQEVGTVWGCPIECLVTALVVWGRGRWRMNWRQMSASPCTERHRAGSCGAACPLRSPSPDLLCYSRMGPLSEAGIVEQCITSFSSAKTSVTTDTEYTQCQADGGC